MEKSQLASSMLRTQPQTPWPLSGITHGQEEKGGLILNQGDTENFLRPNVSWHVKYLLICINSRFDCCFPPSLLSNVDSGKGKKVFLWLEENVESHVWVVWSAWKLQFECFAKASLTGWRQGTVWDWTFSLSPPPYYTSTRKGKWS